MNDYEANKEMWAIIYVGVGADARRRAILPGNAAGRFASSVEIVSLADAEVELVILFCCRCYYEWKSKIF